MFTKDLLSKRAKLVARMEELQNATEVETDGGVIDMREFTADEQAEWGELVKAIEELDAAIERKKNLQSIANKHASPIPSEYPDNPQPNKERADSIRGGEIVRPKATRIARTMRCLALAHYQPIQAAHIARSVFGDEEIAKIMETGTVDDGGALIPTDYYEEIIEFLRPRSIVRNMGTEIINITSPTVIMRVNTGAVASYTGETKKIGETGLKTGGITLTPRQLSALIPISNQLLANPSPSVDVMVRNDLINAFAMREDKAFLLDDGSSNTPKGCRYWANSANVLTMTASPDIAKITNDLGRMTDAVEDADVPLSNPAWVMNSTVRTYLKNLRDSSTSAYAFPELQDGMLQGYPVGVTSQVPKAGGTTEILFVDFGQAVIGENEQIMVNAFDQAVYHDSAGNVVSAVEQNLTVIRAVAAHDFAMRYDRAVSVLTGVTWGV